MGFDYVIHYKSGYENVVVDAFSRVSGSEILCLALSVLDSNLSPLIQKSYDLDLNLMHLISQLQQGVTINKFSYIDGLLRKNHRRVVGPDNVLKIQILKWLHDSGQGGHSGRDATLQRVKISFLLERYD